MESVVIALQDDDITKGSTHFHLTSVPRTGHRTIPSSSRSVHTDFIVNQDLQVCARFRGTDPSRIDQTAAAFFKAWAIVVRRSSGILIDTGNTRFRRINAAEFGRASGS
jgi:hypothetical protein